MTWLSKYSINISQNKEILEVTKKNQKAAGLPTPGKAWKIIEVRSPLREGVMVTA